MVYIARWKIILVLVICVLGLAYAAPNVVDKASLTSVPNPFPNRQMNLGLDLRGGAHLLIQADLKEAITESMNSLQQGIRSALRGARVQYRGWAISLTAWPLPFSRKRITKRREKSFALLPMA